MSDYSFLYFLEEMCYEKAMKFIKRQWEIIWRLKLKVIITEIKIKFTRDPAVFHRL